MTTLATLRTARHRIRSTVVSKSRTETTSRSKAAEATRGTQEAGKTTRALLAEEGTRETSATIVTVAEMVAEIVAEMVE